MNDTVAVAMITAASTLAAVLITGGVSIWVSRVQARHQVRIAMLQSHEQRSARQRDARRAAYAEFLGRADAAYRQLDQRWTEPPPRQPDPARSDPAYAAVRALDEAHNLVLLEGTERVIAQARLVVDSVEREYRDQRGVRDAHPGADRGAAALAPDRHSAAIAARVTGRADFTAAARRALGADLDPAAEPSVRL